MSQFFKSDLFTGSLVLLVTFNLFNFLNFLFQVVMARLLTLAEYGILATLLSITYFGSLLTESIQTIVTRYVAQENRKGRIKNIFKRSFKKAQKLAVAVFIGYCLFAVIFSPLLNISRGILLLVGLVFFSAVLSPVTRGVLQGEKKFSHLGFNLIIESGLRLILGVTLVVAGFALYGAVVATVLGSFLALLASYSLVKKQFKDVKEESTSLQGIYGYSLPMFVILISLMAFYSLDILIAKIYFSAEEVGAYAVASLLAKALFWGTQPVSKALFPISVKDQNNSNKSKKILYQALFLVGLMIVCGLGVFYFFSTQLIHLFSGKIIPLSIKLLVPLGLAMSILSFSNVILLYRLSLGEIKKYWYFILFIVLEILILISSSSDLVTFSSGLVLSSIIFLMGSILVSLRK